MITRETQSIGSILVQVLGGIRLSPCRGLAVMASSSSAVTHIRVIRRCNLWVIVRGRWRRCVRANSSSLAVTPL